MYKTSLCSAIAVNNKKNHVMSFPLVVKA